MTSLASLSDLGARLGKDLTGDIRAEALLDDASARIRRYTGLAFESATSTDRLAVCCGKAQIPHSPVISVDSVTVDGDTLAAGVDYTISARTITFSDPDILFATVTCTWGYAAVPDDIVAVTCQVAGRAFGTNASDAGTTAESLGGWSFSTGGAAAAGPLGLLRDEREVLDSYRHRPIRIQQNVWVG